MSPSAQLLAKPLTAPGAGAPSTISSLARLRYQRSVPKRHSRRHIPELSPAQRTEPLCLAFEVVTERARFDALEADWTALYDRAGLSHQLFQSFNWCWHWANHYLDETRPGPRLAILVARRAGRAVMIWPLVSERIAGLTVVSWLGEPVSQYGDVLVEDGPERPELLAAGLDAVLRRLRPDALALRKVRDDSRIAALLDEHHARVTARTAAPFADVAVLGSKDAYMASLDKKLVKNIKRCRNRLAEQGEVRTLVLREGEAAAARALDALRLKRSWLHRRGLASRAFSDRRIESFFAAVAGSSERPAGCRVAVLEVGGEAAAIEICFRDRDRLACHIKVYDERFEKQGPGKLLTEDHVAAMMQEGPAVYDLIGPMDAYKMEWCDAAVGVSDYALPVTRAGRMLSLVYLGVLREAAKSCLSLLPLRLRRAILPKVA
jgi:CelD/BcsL family acetyltransferase involved in cellulose biosynthesis